MRVKLRFRKNQKSLHEGTYDIADSESFGAACADTWLKLHERNLAAAGNIGAAMDVTNQDVLEQLNGAEIGLAKL